MAAAGTGKARRVSLHNMPRWHAFKMLRLLIQRKCHPSFLVPRLSIWVRQNCSVALMQYFIFFFFFFLSLPLPVFESATPELGWKIKHHSRVCVIWGMIHINYTQKRFSYRTVLMISLFIISGRSVTPKFSHQLGCRPAGVDITNIWLLQPFPSLHGVQTDEGMSSRSRD